MEIAPENQNQENKPASGEAEKGNDKEELAKEIPTVTPDNDNDDVELNPSQQEE